MAATALQSQNQTVPMDAIRANQPKTDGRKSLDMNRDTFLKLLIAQAKYQDPTSPSDVSKMVQHAALFAQTEQTVQTNEILRDMQKQNGDMALAQIAGLIGKEIEVDLSERQFYGAGTKVAYQFELGGNTTHSLVRITDEAGHDVYSDKIGAHTKGPHEYIWDGKRADGKFVKGGLYTIHMKSYNMNSAVDTLIGSKKELIKSLAFDDVTGR